MKEIFGIKPQDILMLLKLVLDSKEPVVQMNISRELGMSQAEVSNSLARLKGSRLINSDNKPAKPNVVEFLLSGVKYVYPCAPGPITRGTPTAHSGPPLNQRIKSNPNDIYVWPDADGTVSGQAIIPIYPSAVAASKKDSRLYEMLALLDALRVGRAREVEIAKEELKLRVRGKV